MTTVTVLLFGPLREAAGWSERAVAGASVDEVWQAVCRDCPSLAGHRAAVRPAVDLAYTSWDQAVQDGASVAFIPPVAGGWR